MTGIFTYKNFALSDTPRLDGKVAVVTVCVMYMPLRGLNMIISHPPSACLWLSFCLPFFSFFSFFSFLFISFHFFSFLIVIIGMLLLYYNNLSLSLPAKMQDITPANFCFFPGRSGGNRKRQV